MNPAGPLVAADSPGSRANADLVVGFFQRVLSGARDVAAARDLLAPDFVDHDAAGSDSGPAGVAAKLEGLWSALPDGAYRLERLVAAGDLVSAHSVLEARDVRVPFADLYRIRDGRIVEHWHVVDADELGRQLAARSGQDA